MDKLIDDVARIFATQMPRRRAFKILGGTLAAAVVAAFGGAIVNAGQQDNRGPRRDRCTDAQLQNGANYNCGNGVANQICCPRGTCCAKHGNDAQCCTPGQCVCKNGTCAASTGGACPKNCTRCTPS